MPERFDDHGSTASQPALPFGDLPSVEETQGFVEYDPRIRHEDWSPPQLPDLRGFRFVYHGQRAELVDAGVCAGPTAVALEPLSYWTIRINGGRPVKVASTTCRRFVEEELSRQADAHRTDTGVDDAPRTINDLIRAYHEQLHRLQDFDVPDAEFEVFGVRAADDQQRRAARAQSAYADLIADGADMDTIRDEVRRIERPSGRYSGNPRGNRTSAQAAERLTADLFSQDEEFAVDRATVDAAAADHRESSIDHNDDTGRADPYDLAI
jgi:hypothetical protein